MHTLWTTFLIMRPLRRLLDHASSATFGCNSHCAERHTTGRNACAMQVHHTKSGFIGGRIFWTCLKISKVLPKSFHAYFCTTSICIQTFQRTHNPKSCMSSCDQSFRTVEFKWNHWVQIWWAIPVEIHTSPVKYLYKLSILQVFWQDKVENLHFFADSFVDWQPTFSKLCWCCSWY